jgi:glycosyltransferase involved in cell wall biosynthesis
MKKKTSKFPFYFVILGLATLLAFIPNNLLSTLFSLAPLQKVSIVIIAHNEHSYLMRTLEAIASTAAASIQEIVIIDDYSSPSLDTLFEDSQNPQIPGHFILVRLERNHHHEGLIRSKLKGAALCTSDIIVFLEAHVKPLDNWLEPLIEPIKKDYKTIVTPLIPILNEDYTITSTAVGVKMLFTWGMTFDWFDDGDDRVPIISGGIFAVSKKWWNEFGSLDSGMLLWGAENIEMSVRAWLCGGKIVVARESKIAHLFRASFPYKIDDSQVMKNKMRAVKVWFTEIETEQNPDKQKNYMIPWKERVFLGDPNLRNFDDKTGDLTERNHLRNTCDDFSAFVLKFQKAFFDQKLLNPEFALVVNGQNCLITGTSSNHLLIAPCDWKDLRQKIRIDPVNFFLKTIDGASCLNLDPITNLISWEPNICGVHSLRIHEGKLQAGSKRVVVQVPGKDQLSVLNYSDEVNDGTKWSLSYFNY